MNASARRASWDRIAASVNIESFLFLSHFGSFPYFCSPLEPLSLSLAPFLIFSCFWLLGSMILLCTLTPKGPRSSAKMNRSLTDLDDCASNPCAYGAACVDEIENYRCICPEGRSGDRCERVIGKPPPKPPSCIYRRMIYDHGRNWSIDCKNCHCDKGKVICVEVRTFCLKIFDQLGQRVAVTSS